MASFLERLRAPGLSIGGRSYSDAGKRDLLLESAQDAMLERMSDRGGRIAPMRGGRGQGPGPRYNPYGRAMGPEGPMNVVYDQRPEQFNKEMQLRDKDLEVRRETNAVMNAIRQQNADTAAHRADAYAFGIENPLGQVVQPRGGNIAVINRRTGSATDTGVGSGTMTEEDKLIAQAEAALNAIGARGDSAIRVEQERQGGRVDLAEMARDARLAAIDAQGKNAADRQEDAQAFTADRPREHSAALNQRARDVFGSSPEYAGAIEFDPQGNFRIKSDIDDDLRKRVTKEIYGERKTDINLGKGSDSRAVDPNAFNAGVGQVRRQRNPATGEVRESRDGGKTWTIVGR